MSNTNLIHALSLWTEFNTTVRRNTKTCGYVPPDSPVKELCILTRSCYKCFMWVDKETQDKTIESLDRHTGWKL